MRVRLLNQLQVVAAALCFAEAAKLPKNDPGPVLTGVMGFLLLLRGIKATPEAAPMILSRCILVGIMVAGDEGFIGSNSWFWTVIVIVVAIPAIFWPKIEKLWKQRLG
jgi:hypothetical protein